VEGAKAIGIVENPKKRLTYVAQQMNAQPMKTLGAYVASDTIRAIMKTMEKANRRLNNRSFKQKLLAHELQYDSFRMHYAKQIEMLIVPLIA